MRPTSLKVLRERIKFEYNQITPEILQSVGNRFEEDLCHCKAISGGNFQHSSPLVIVFSQNFDEVLNVCLI